MGQLIQVFLCHPGRASSCSVHRGSAEMCAADESCGSVSARCPHVSSRLCHSLTCTVSCSLCVSSSPVPPRASCVLICDPAACVRLCLVSLSMAAASAAASPAAGVHSCTRHTTPQTSVSRGGCRRTRIRERAAAATPTATRMQCTSGHRCTAEGDREPSPTRRTRSSHGARRRTGSS